MFSGLAAVAAAPGFTSARIGGETFNLELALDAASRNRGLMYRENIPADGGMLFVFPGNHPRRFWMANCLVDMDILFLDSNGMVTTVREMFAEPLRGANESPAEYYARLPRYPSDGPARFAIELKHGTAERLGIRVGDLVAMDIDTLLPMAR